MIEYSGKRQNFVVYFMYLNVLILIGAGIYVVRGHEWPSATFLIVINIIVFGYMLSKNQLVRLVILEAEGLVRIEVERWIKVRETLEYSINDIEVEFEVQLRGKIFSKKDIFRIYVEDDLLVEVQPSESGWKLLTLKQVAADLAKHKTSV